MSREEAKQALQPTEQDIVWACQVLDKLSEALDKVAAYPELFPQLIEELVRKAGDITEAFMYVSDIKFWPIIADVSKSWIALVKKWQELRKQATTS